MNIPVYLIDTFTSIKFKGNPTSVCVCKEELNTISMHAVAKELNLPVTAFVSPDTRDNTFQIRYYTVTGEIPACGHATLASAKIIFELNAVSEVKFETADKIMINAQVEKDIIYMSYPVFETEAFDVSESIKTSLGLKNYQPIGFCKNLETLFIEVETAELLRQIQPDFTRLLQSSDQIKEVVITCISDNGQYDFMLRSFCPWIGINEDPVTGSVHSVLGNFWKNRLHKNELIAYQASERGGDIYLDVSGEKVKIGGKVCMILKGEISSIC